jgi:hypothetical protein
MGAALAILGTVRRSRSDGLRVPNVRECAKVAWGPFRRVPDKPWWSFDGYECRSPAAPCELRSRPPATPTDGLVLMDDCNRFVREDGKEE